MFVMRPMRRLMIGLFLAGLLAAVIFQVGLDPRVAGLVAGTGFIAIGIFGALTGWRARKQGFLALAVLGMALVHLLVVAIPMLGFRLMNWSEPFSKVEVWGLSGPQFHTLSTRFFGAWMVVVAVAIWKETKEARATELEPRKSSF